MTSADKPSKKTTKTKNTAATKTNKTVKTPSKSKPEIFYYERRQIIALTLVYALVAILVWKLTKCIQYTPLINNSFFCVLSLITIILSLAALAGVVYVLNFPPTLAVADASGIKIDHNELLKWQDIAYAEERLTSSLFCRKILVLPVKEGCRYRLTFMQKLCRYNVFTPFSIPLYAMCPEDAERITQLIKKHVKNYKPLAK